MKKIVSVFSALWYYLWGHIFAFLFYDSKFLTGKWFSNSHHGLGALGWQWVTYDAIGRIFGKENKSAKYPINQMCRTLCPQNIIFDVDDLNNFQGSGNYFQALAKIYIGKGTFIAPNVGLITGNHDINDPEKRLEPKEIHIGKKCWIGMNAMILPGVELGDHTVVGAGSVVTKSFPDGYVVIAGNPAKIIKTIDKEN